MVSIQSSHRTSVPLQELQESIQRSIDEQVPVHIEVDDGPGWDVAFKESPFGERQAAGTTIDGDLILVNFPPKELEEIGYPVVVIGR